MEYENLIESFTNDFIREFGERKYFKILDKVNNSRSVRNTIEQFNELQIIPGNTDIVATIMNIPFFMLANKMTIAMGGVILIDLWNKKINNNGEIADDFEVVTLYYNVLRKCGQMI